jgi:glycosyltransferase involved in cell wall biosynthesis
MISFIIPAYNEEMELSATLAAIHAAASDAGQPYEIIVVDDASTDGTPDIAAQAGAKIVRVNRRQIAAARNAGAGVARGKYLFFVDADTRINWRHVAQALAALQDGYAGGGARVTLDGFIPPWARIMLRIFCAIYFGLNLGAGAFLFTTRRNFEAIGGFDEQYFIGEEVYFSLALRRLGRFKVLSDPVVTSGRKLRIYSARQVFGDFLRVIFGGRRVALSRATLRLWYEGRRENSAA